MGACSGDQPLGRYETFIVRLWTDGAEESTRGHIQHIASRRGIYFRDAGKMLQFIGEHLGPATLADVDERNDQADGREPDLQPADGGETDDR